MEANKLNVLSKFSLPTMNIRIGIQFMNFENQVRFGDILWQVDIKRLDSNFCTSFPFHIHIALGILPLANNDNG